MTLYYGYIVVRVLFALAGLLVLWSIYSDAQVAKYRRFAQEMADARVKAWGLDYESLKRGLDR